MTIDFLIGAIRASRDLHPQVKTELEEILHRYPVCMTLGEVKGADFAHVEFQGVIWENCAVHVMPYEHEIRFTDEENRNLYLDEAGYQDSWRCWTEYPSGKRMQEEPWLK